MEKHRGHCWELSSTRRQHRERKNISYRGTGLLVSSVSRDRRRGSSVTLVWAGRLVGPDTVDETPASRAARASLS